MLWGRLKRIGRGLQESFKTLVEKFSEAFTACSICMVQGDLSVFSLGHAMKASETGALTGVGAVVAFQILKTKSAYIHAWVTSVVCFASDLLVHPTHFGEWWAEAAVTGLGAGVLAFVFHRTLESKRKSS